jgi:hypothetical protein
MIYLLHLKPAVLHYLQKIIFQVVSYADRILLNWIQTT